MSPRNGQVSTWLGRIVGADVHANEWRLVLLLFSNLFLLLTAYYILKVIREPLILLGGTAVHRSYARGLQAGLLIFILPAYSLLANRVEPARLVKWITAVFVVSLAGFFVARRAGVSVGFAFFVWLGIFSTLSIAQFWSIANDVMTEAQGKRLFPLLAVGGTAGGIVGAQFAARAVARMSAESMMLVSAGLLVACMYIAHASHAVGVAHRYGPHGPPPEPRDPRGAFTLVVGDRYLLLIALSVIALNLITATGDFLLAQMVAAKAHALPVAARARYIGAFYGNLQTWVTALTALVQIFVVARLFRAVGVGGALLFMPLLVVVGYAAFALVPLLAAATAVKFGESTTDYSLQNTVEHALFLPTSRDAKYKAKSAIDTLSKRLGDLGSTALVFLGTSAALGVRGFAVANVVAGIVWLWLTLQLKRRRKALAVARTQAGVVAATSVLGGVGGGASALALGAATSGTEKRSFMAATVSADDPHGSGSTPSMDCTVFKYELVSYGVFETKPGFARGETARKGGSSAPELPSSQRMKSTPPCL
jgi:AAA family ATP:ADP antiporter